MAREMTRSLFSRIEDRNYTGVSISDRERDDDIAINARAAVAAATIATTIGRVNDKR